MTFSKLYIYFLFLMIPFVGGYIPSLGGLKGLTGEIVFLLVFPLVLIPLMLVSSNIGKKRRPKVSRIAIWYFLYNIYGILNSVIQQTELKESRIVGFILVLAFLIVIDNQEYTERDSTIFNNILAIVGIGTFVASVIQLTIDPFFYRGLRPAIVDQISKYQLSQNLYRNNSIFTGLDPNEGGIAIGYLAIVFLFLNYHRMKLRYMILTAMLFVSAFITFARYVWLMPITGLLFFVIHKSYNRIVHLATYCFLASLLILTIYFYLPSISSSKFYQERFLSPESSLARTESSHLFFTEYFLAKPVFGYGESSWYSEAFVAHWGHGMGIHVGLVDIIYEGGLLGLFIFFGFVYQIYMRGATIYKQTGNPVFVVLPVVWLLINLTAILTHMSYYGYYLMLFYLFLYHKLTKDKLPLANHQLRHNIATRLSNYYS